MSRYSFLVSNCSFIQIFFIFDYYTHNIIGDLDIENNDLSGYIPRQIGTLNALEKLNLGAFITECGECKNIIRN